MALFNLMLPANDHFPFADAVTTALAGAQALRAVNHSVSLIVGIVVVSVSEIEPAAPKVC